MDVFTPRQTAIIGAGIMLDSWKMDIFRRHLNDAGFEFTHLGEPTPNVIALRVDVENADLPRLSDVISEAEKDARKWKKRQKLN